MRRYRQNYKPGDWVAVCAVCGFKYKASELKLRWDNQYVCEKDWEPRHPMDFIRAIEDDQKVEWVRPEPDDVFIETYSSSAIAGVAISGSAIAGVGDGKLFSPYELTIKVIDVSKSAICSDAIAGYAVAGDNGYGDVVLTDTIIPGSSFSYQEILFTDYQRDSIQTWSMVDVEIISSNFSQIQISELKIDGDV